MEGRWIDTLRPCYAETGTTAAGCGIFVTSPSIKKLDIRYQGKQQDGITLSMGVAIYPDH
jgi:hypothetical protein